MKHFLINVKCDFCSSEKNVQILKTKDYIFNSVPGEFNIVKCLNCNLIFTNPRLKTEVLNKYYSKFIRYGDPTKTSSSKEKSKKTIKTQNIFTRADILTEYFNYPLLKKSKLRKLILFPYYLRIRKRLKKTFLIPMFKKNGKILEIGCSNGFYLNNLKKLGWIVKGLELNENAVNYAKKRFNLDVENEDFITYKANTLYDTIYLNMVLEHLESPKEALEKCYSLLKFNGKLILKIPDFSGFERRIYKKYAYTLHLPYHLFHFTPFSIKNYLKVIKFRKIKILHDNYDRDLISPLKFILRDNPERFFIKYIADFVHKKFIRKTLIKALVNLFSYLGKTSRMIVTAHK